MKLNELAPAAGAKTEAKRKGRGPATGNGKTGGRGHKGQNARSGGGVRRGFEGGQMPITRRLPKRGFHNHFAKDYVTVNIADLERFSGKEATVESLLEAGVISRAGDGLKVLGNGELKKAVSVKAAKFTATAKEKIEAAGGKAEVI